MSSGNYETQILDAIQMLVDNAVSKAEYDRTIQGTISRCVDATIGKYIVKYQNSSFYAYSYNTDVAYPAGTSVYVLVPGNDMSKDKSIIGTVDKLGPDYVSIIEGESGYEVTGVNVINSDAIFELCSYKEKDVKVLYDKENNIDLINLDVFGFEAYVKKSNSIICGATFKTSLPAEQQFRGDYGIAFNLDFMDNATGETVTKTFIVNVDQMKGNPYNYSTKSRQYGIFDIDGTNFLAVNQIYIFGYDFPNIAEDKPNDIFISNFELSAANALDATEAATCALTFITPQGTYFDDNDLDSDIRTLQAQIRIKGNAIDNNSQLVKYYWFIENNNITNKSEKYNQYGGAGWECLNEANIIQAATENTDAIVQWVSGTYEYKTEKRNNIAKETNYKCVAVYSNDTVLSRTITIYNYSSDFAIEIKSDEGTAFYYDLGSPTLTCYVNGEEALSEDYEYVWSEINNANQFAVLNETTEENKEYNDAFDNYNNLMEQVKLEQVLTGQIQEDLDVYERILAQYENVMRVEGNKIHNLKISAITTFSTYKCSVYKNGIFIGTASIIITNSLQNENAYTLVINNGNQVFKYNEQGIAPTNPALENPVTILPLSFTLYDNKGQKVNYNAIGGKNVFWSVPSRNSLINISTVHGNPTTSNENTDTYTEYEELNFDIDTQYDVKRDNNEIQLTVNYKDKVLSAKTNFTFTKEGEAGTNGTDFICKIVPNNTADSLAPLYPTVTYNEYNKTYSLNYTPVETEKWFKVQLWHDGEEIFTGLETGMTDENAEATVQWSILKNNYGNNVEDNSNLSIDANTGAITFNPDVHDDAANIVKCTITYKGISYYAVMPVIVAKVKNSDYTINLAERTGFRNVLYTADGQTPSYDSANPFEVIITQNINGIKENISQLELSEFAVNYSWDVCGTTYFKEWQLESNLIEKTLFSSREKRNQKYYEPIDSYNGLCVNNAVLCTISRGEEYIGSIHMPIHFYLNRHGNAAMNGWDGNSISIDKDNSGVILAPQVGAGQKNEDNTFTGIFMGSIKEAGAEEIETGLFGYNSGERTIALSAYDGSAKFGKEGAGQIVIDPSTNEALLTSGNYDEEAGTGMIINLSEPSIKFGSGNFKVDKNGNVVAKGFATGGDLEEAKESLKQDIEKVEESIKAFDIKIDFTAFNFSCNSEQYPINDSTFNVNYEGIYKNTPLDNKDLTITMKNDAVAGITANIDTKGIISFSVETEEQIPNLQNTFTFEFTYTDSEGNIYTDTKSIYISLSVQGKDGAQGEQGPKGEDGKSGKSAYEIAQEEGFEGTEEEWLASLIGKDGENGKPGAPGENGKTSYLHIAYANSEDGKTDFSTTDSVGKLYIGQYTDFVEADSTDPDKYHWTLIKGEQGPQGDKGETGDKGDTGETGVGIKEIIEQYNLSNSNTTYYENNWVETQPEWKENHYFWTRSKVIYTDDTIKYTPAVLAQALNNANSTANTANTNASNAVNTANSASSAADQAKQDAAAANQTANNASSKADTAIANSNSTSQALNTLKEEVREQYDDLQGQIDGAIETWFENYEPTLENYPANQWEVTEEINEKENHIGDLFYIIDNEEKGGQCYRFAKVGNGYQWIIVEDVGVAKAIADAAKAQQSADGAQSSADIAKGIADGKATVFFGKEAPAADKPQLGDLWMNSESGEILTYTDKEWEKLNTYTDDTVANEAKDLANDANSTANTAKDTANEAKSTADNANQTANSASQQVQKTVKQVDVEYYVSTAEDKLEGGEWKTDEPTWTPGTFIWSRQKMTLVDGTTEYSNPARITGAKGETGETGSAGKGIKETVIEYVVTNGNEEIPTTGWDKTFPTSTPTGKYIWTKTTIKYTEGEPSISYSVSRVGEDGSPGNPGEPGTSVTITEKHIHYVVSASGTEIPSDSANWVEAENNQLPTTKEDEFLWSRTWIIYSDGTEAKTYSVSRNPKNGEKGDKGDDGASAKLVTIAASSTIFKSNTGKNGTFYPNNITLTPDFQGVTGETVSWQYALDGATWINAVNGQHGITLNTNTKELIISKDTDLFTDDNSIITFKCIAEDNATYNTISISKIYDIVDMNIGARNYALKTATAAEMDIDIDPYYGGFYKLSTPLKQFENSKITISAEFSIGKEDNATGQIKFWGASYQTDDDGNTTTNFANIGANSIQIMNFNANTFIKKSQTLMISAEVAAHEITHLGFQISGFTGHLVIQKFKVETGDVATDWTLAFEDLQNQEMIEYALTNTADRNELETATWAQQVAVSANQYLWQRSVTVNNGEYISIGEAICISRPEKTLTDSLNHYYESTSSSIEDIPDILTSKDWITTKPIWTEEKKDLYLWVSTQYFYSDGTWAYATPYLDTSWESYGSLDKNLLDYKDLMEERLSGGYVSIKDGRIEVFDSWSGATSKKKIVIDNNGIGYAFKNEDTGEWTPRSVWGIDGSFDAELLTVYNLTADEIKDGVLKLGAPNLTAKQTLNSVSELPSTGDIGDAYLVYIDESKTETEWWVWNQDKQAYEKREGGYLELTDEKGVKIAKMSQDGLEVLASDGSRVNIFAHNDNSEENNNECNLGLCLRDSSDKIIAHTNTSLGTWNVKKQVVEESLEIGTSIQIVPIGKGIGFVSIYNTNSTR